MQNALKLSVAGIVALVFVAVATPRQQNNVPQQDAEYSAQTQSAENVFQADSISAPSEVDFKHYNERYCRKTDYSYQGLLVGVEVPAQTESFIRSEKKRCVEVMAEYARKYPPGSVALKF